jgi:hypothetical protein
LAGEKLQDGFRGLTQAVFESLLREVGGLCLGREGR